MFHFYLVKSGSLFNFNMFDCKKCFYAYLSLVFFIYVFYYKNSDYFTLPHYEGSQYAKTTITTRNAVLISHISTTKSAPSAIIKSTGSSPSITTNGAFKPNKTILLKDQLMKRSQDIRVI